MKKLVAVASLVSVLFLSACGLKAGEVYDKHYEPSRTWVDCVAKYNDKGVQTGCTPQTKFRSESFTLFIKDCKKNPNDCETGRVNVSESVYSRVQIGEWYTK